MVNYEFKQWPSTEIETCNKTVVSIYFFVQAVGTIHSTETIL